MVLEFGELVTGTGVIVGFDTVCINTEVPYSIIGLNGADNYTWTISPSSGAQVISGQGTNMVNIDFTSLGIYNLTVVPSNPCGLGNPISLSIEVIEFNLELTSAVGSDNQILCETEPLVAIEYQFSGGATSADVAGLPNGVTFDITANQVTISGTPTDDITTQTVYNYTVSTLGGNCVNTSLQGTITVDPQGSGLLLTSAPGTDASRYM